MNSNSKQKNILVAPLNWGLGHATRCIPIIKELERNGFTPILASDGNALQLLAKEFPHLKSLELPSYGIEYSKRARNFKWNIIKKLPKILKAIKVEKKLVKQWVEEYQLNGIISDNRLGVRNRNLKSVIITHQLNVLSGTTTWLTTKAHQYYIKKFTECWIPDMEGLQNFSGQLGHLTPNQAQNFNLKYIGILSRFEKKYIPKKYDLMVILSGPEPQRGILEQKITEELEHYQGNVLFVNGVIEASQRVLKKNNITFYNYMQTNELEVAFNESDIILCRSGYTTIMELVKLEKNAFFIPTPGQYEQEYLARKFKKSGVISYCKQEYFKIERLEEVKLYLRFKDPNLVVDWESLFELF
ncbi:glycosyltransferase [Flavobacterium aciduliphilum]|uniref:Uncharacterized protein (TIGR00661 family) n=1 Tax=Flavobacterium aciduliphilum TaxID=1101402 RepID=A0A328YGT9_9FLAO|nr:glycosyltransferase [Flavobacterium aciduliphilum]RAR72514.1 uncharacterized protein (TIGR00661 family) [Flavobacterium aciduliphilum]